jgi:hypothetical protein
MDTKYLKERKGIYESYFNYCPVRCDSDLCDGMRDLARSGQGCAVVRAKDVGLVSSYVKQVQEIVL